MTYDFTTCAPRYDIASPKYTEMERVLGYRPGGIIPFSVADMEFPLAPEIREALHKMIDEQILGYSSAWPSFHAAVCGWMKRRFDWDIRPEWILPSPGVVNAFFAAVKCFSEEGDGVILFTPVYYPMYQAVTGSRRKLVECPLLDRGTSYEIDFDDFEKKCQEEKTKLLILCSPHNPGGRVWTAEELRRISEICLKNHVLVISDEIHGDIIMPGFRHTIYATVSEEASRNCVILTAPSKTFNLAGLQTSNVIVPELTLRKQLLRKMKETSPYPECNILGYRACEAAYDHGEEWLRQCLAVIHRNEQTVRAFLAEHLPQVKVFELQGTYLLWMDWRALGLDYKELERINRQEALVFFDEGHLFGERGQGFERWNLACPEKYIPEACERLWRAYRKYI